MNTFDPTQHPRGNQTTGHAGQFATKAQTSSEIGLAGADPRGSLEHLISPTSTNRAETVLFHPMVRNMPQEAGSDSIISLSIGARHGDLNGAGGALVNYLRDDAGVEGQDRARALLRDQTDRKVTVLTHGNSGSLRVIEGRAMTLNGTDYLIQKGSRSKAYPIDSLNVIDARDGYGQVKHFEDQARMAASAIPDIGKATVDGIPGDESEHDEVAAVFIYNAPNFNDDHSGRGSILYATDITEDGDDPIVNGAFVFPPNSGLTSEHGSIRLSELSRNGGRVKAFQSTTFVEALKYGDEVNDGSRNMAELYAEL